MFDKNVHDDKNVELPSESRDSVRKRI